METVVKTHPFCHFFYSSISPIKRTVFLLLHSAKKNSTDKAKISFVYTVKGEKTYAIEGTRSSEYPEISLKKI